MWRSLARVLVISFSDLSSDPRVDRQIAALLTKHCVVAAGLSPSGHEGVEFIDIATPPLRLLDRGMGGIRLLAHRFEAAYWRQPKYGEVLRRLQNTSADVVLANEIASLPIALRLGPPVLVDAHEYAPEEFVERWWWRQLLAPYVRWQCGRYLSSAAVMTTVSEGIAETYYREFGVRPVVVTNAPPYADLEPTPVKEPVRILHHGGAQHGRGLEEMVRLADLLDERFTLDFVLVEQDRGFRDELIARARHNPRVRFPAPVPMRKLVGMASAYDIGLFLLPPNNLSHKYALPNKLFEFVQARLAVAIGPSLEMASLVRHYGCGVIASTFEPESLATELNALDADAIVAFKRASHVAAAELNAERNAELLLGVVEEALGAGL
ncbi:MAG TPA: hypothetical protein VNF91_10460 [Candidatus Acidoferrum sp.]|nr:hypothetical protein [Candidatus Acidoferrum sp.]